MIKINFSISRRLKRYFAEMMLIIISVLLAFILSEFRNDYNEKKKLITSLEFIKDEITQNQIYVNEIITAHKRIINTIDSLLVNEKYNEIYSTENGFTFYNIYPGSFFTQLLSNDAWNIANNNTIFDKLNIDNVVTLSRAYEQQTLVMKTVWEINDILQSEAMFDKQRTKTNCKILKSRFGSLLGLEIRLCYNYKNALNTLSEIVN